MRSIGFHHEGGHYRHPTAPFFVEFPAGPLGIGADLTVEPVAYRVGKLSVRALSPTDSCRDRLAGFYHWNDRQSLMAAVAIARRHRVDITAIAKWSEGEGEMVAFEQFRRLLRSSRELKRRPHRAPSRRLGRPRRSR